jgi:uncharacterized protein YndB with AHSA1/START domain
MSRTIDFAPVLKSIDVNAPPQRAFEVFAAFRWWPKSHSILASKSPQVAVTVEPRVGGRWYERGEDGSECDWGKVLSWDPPKRMVLSWHLNASFQIDPTIATEVVVTFEPRGAGSTHVALEHRLFERHGAEGEKIRAAVDSPDGWGGLLSAFAAMADSARAGSG